MCSSDLERGDACFGPVALRVVSRWRLWEFHRRLPVASAVRVYPNFAAIVRLAPLDIEQQAQRIGVHVQAPAAPVRGQPTRAHPAADRLRAPARAGRRFVDREHP